MARKFDISKMSEIQLFRTTVPTLGQQIPMFSDITNIRAAQEGRFGGKQLIGALRFKPLKCLNNFLHGLFKKPRMHISLVGTGFLRGHGQ